MSKSRIRFRRPDLWKPVSGAMQAVPPADCPNGWGYVRREDYAALEFEYRLALIKLNSAGRRVGELMRKPVPAPLADDQIDALVDRHFRHNNHPDSYAALRATIKDAIYAAIAAASKPAIQAPGAEQENQL